jgi:hypothetical protein
MLSWRTPAHGDVLEGSGLVRRVRPSTRSRIYATILPWFNPTEYAFSLAKRWNRAGWEHSAVRTLERAMKDIDEIIASDFRSLSGDFNHVCHLRALKEFVFFSRSQQGGWGAGPTLSRGVGPRDVDTGKGFWRVKETVSRNEGKCIVVSYPRRRAQQNSSSDRNGETICSIACSKGGRVLNHVVVRYLHKDTPFPDITRDAYLDGIIHGNHSYGDIATSLSLDMDRVPVPNRPVGYRCVVAQLAWNT